MVKFRKLLTTKLAACIVSAGLAVLLTAGVFKFQYINDRVTGGPSKQAQAQALATKLLIDVPTTTASLSDAQAAIGATAARSGCAVHIGVGVFADQTIADTAVASLKGILLPPYATAEKVDSATGAVTVIYVAMDC